MVELKHGAYYSGTSRNASLARWDEKRDRFIHWRVKFGQRFLDELEADRAIYQHFDTFVVEREVPEPTDERERIPLESGQVG